MRGVVKIRLTSQEHVLRLELYQCLSDTSTHLRSMLKILTKSTASASFNVSKGEMHQLREGGPTP